MWGCDHLLDCSKNKKLILFTINHASAGETIVGETKENAKDAF
jgi:hypothetical protein